MNKEKFIAWGHKLHSHTHSYVTCAFINAFRHLGYDVYHFDNSDDVSGFDFSNSIFLTEVLYFSAISLKVSPLLTL